MKYKFLMKKILSLLTSVALMTQFVGTTLAADPKVVFSIDCNTQERQTVIGYQSNPDDLPSGAEVIALKFTFRLTPTGTTTLDDIKNATLMANPAYSSFIVAENTKTQNASNIDIKFAGGFTGGNGATHASDLIFVKGINQKEYQMNVVSGELYPKNSTTNIYTATTQSYAANPTSCGQTNTNTNTNTNSNTNTNTNTNNTNTSTTNSQNTTIDLSSNKVTAKAGDSVEVTAVIKNRNGQAIDWSQTSGTQINPTITNEEVSATETKSVLKFTMVESTQDVVLRATVGGVTETITVKTETPAAPTNNSAPETGTQGEQTLQERLQERLEQLNNNQANTQTPATQTPGNVHAAAGSLSESGPKETMLMIVLSLGIALGWKRLRRSELDVNV